MSIYDSKNKNKYRLIVSILIGTAIPIVCLWLWYDINIFNEYMLITQDKITANGYIISAEEDEDVVEANDGRTSNQVFYYGYKYTFKLPNGKIINSYSKGEYGRLPEYLLDVSNNPYPVKIEYLPNNPNISKVIDFYSGSKTILEWFRRRIVIGITAFIFCSYLGYVLIKSGIKKYSIDMATFKKLENDSKQI